ncbi:PREDICTED: ubiquitin carboxyl-terminal hydrolase 8 [Dufourea novaeangliae]|uniref:ubiquitin carboxyl-terminal hydrolase 8 n=1 Tax=Dufourea novaeangliae TaxID=178035 RepID=UPI00076763E5|nr:PREDICTED: ubiquitin carboxyl-terminal hydrolase 8 [Dufourea novaeangliae]XP_015429539.1 PREDICTED: ubiquitin carboxyl-terminal hydrolase 8 [Dufourea novaeangliae]XP_015429540.1 PREDICTED: ubiquitin carboxyl-terminal hydrolase 8 [Dufourea novaeangliae]XP_015429541.1 PREDICTED: ubiquitin carboxyl-terminal hydrolase 8 [Dufourea novaeangliae]
MSEKTSPLHYTSINDLLQKTNINYKNKKPAHIYNRLPQMYNMAEDSRKNGNEEVQYIMLKRWLNSIEWLKTTHEYKDDKTHSLPHMHANQINEVKKKLADLNERLDKRYKQNRKEKLLGKNNSVDKMDIDNVTETDSYMTPIDEPIKLPETPTRDPLVGDNEEIINCNQLFPLVQDIYGRYLIIDIRPKSQFESSKILCNHCVNIPSSKIKLGLLASHFEKFLHKDKKALDLYRHRGVQFVDVIILLDSNTSSKTLTPNNSLSIFRKILENWDPGIKHGKITILDGGYAEWITRYPAFTTNPNISEPTLNNTSNEMLDNIEYPEWIHSDEEDSINKTHENKTVNVKTINTEKVSRINVSSDKTDVSRKYNNNSLEPQYKRTLTTIKRNDISMKPTVDRSNKPVSSDTFASEAKAVLKLMGQLNELAKNKHNLEQEILEQERALYMQYSSEYKSTNEEELIRDNLKILRLKLEDKQKEYEKVENDLAKNYPKMALIKFNPAEEHEKGALDLKLGLLKMGIKNVAAARKKLQEKSMKNDYKELSAKENEHNIHREPLKSDNSSSMGNLERSYSSPNLLQLIDRKAPRVDRTSKPQTPSQNQNGSLSNETKVSHVSWANREERMNPVHGSVHPGITGLKNLGNSCYMNSIIQCLSNTTHLAKYFTDNLYADDLNTSNDNSTQGQVVEEVAQVIKVLWRGQYKSISPRDLKIAVGQYKLQFESYEQQDSHEFLTFLLDWMHNDLKKKCKVPLEMTVAEEAWDKAMGSQRSIISDLFFGQLRSTITCSFCKQSSTTYETFNSLTTSLPHSNRCTLNDCILKFVTGQKVVGWKCPKCQTAREATKKFDFVKLAPIIVIHLNRFAESGGWLEKRNTAVDFPLTGLNLKPYLVMDSTSATISNIRSYNYSLYAMSNHYGTMEGGHYTAFCKNSNQNKWYKYDDQTVTEVSVNQVRSQNTSAYLLFYTSFSSNII